MRNYSEEELEAARQYLAGTQLQINEDHFILGLQSQGWTIHPIRYKEQIAGGIIDLNGDMHTAVHPKYQKKWNPKPYIQNILYPNLKKHKILKSYAPINDIVAQTWITKLGFQESYRTNDQIHYILTHNLKFTAKELQMKSRINQLIDLLASDLHERKEIVGLCLLAVLSGQSVFLYGPPGTAKSLIARRISNAFKSATHFEYLMSRFSTPEEIFGPVSIHELKEDRYTRKTEGYLPTADFAFLDEIWKSSPAILNALLTILNEKKFRNGDIEIDVPLKGLISASNEMPQSNQGLEALFDRFILRLPVYPLKEKDSFFKLLDTNSTSKIDFDDNLKFDESEWHRIQSQIQQVEFTEDCKQILHLMRVSLDIYNKKQENPKLQAVVSDRRWLKIAQLIKSAAFFAGRNSTLPVDLLLVGHCVWTHEENECELKEICRECINPIHTQSQLENGNYKIIINAIKNEYKEKFFYEKDVLENTKIKGKYCIKKTTSINNTNSDYYIPTGCILSKQNSFHPLDSKGNEISWILLKHLNKNKFELQIKKSVSVSGFTGFYTPKTEEFIKHGSIEIIPEKLKNTPKNIPVNDCIQFLSNLENIQSQVNMQIEETTTLLQKQKTSNEHPFIPKSESDFLLNNFENHLQELKDWNLDLDKIIIEINSQYHIKSFELK